MSKILFYPFFILFALTALCFEGQEFIPVRREGGAALDYHSYLQESLRDRDWWSAIDYAGMISRYFPDSPFAQEADFLAGDAYYKLGQLDLANESFSAYLGHSASPKHFEEAILYKFNIAEQFRSGVKKHLFGSHKLPKILSADEDAIQIYDEVVTAFPHDEVAAKALLGKAELQAKAEDYKSSLETLDLLIRRFPKHDLAVRAFLEKSRVYHAECKEQSLDPALLDLADLNLRKFRLAFPREDRLAEAEKGLRGMQEIFAEHLMETGRFFEKTHKIPASIIYYSKVLSQYPETEAASIAKTKLESLQASGHL
ncbi:MAG: outer membrane protein assembly factor BamD [Chlamydiia bacterium]|nr:outer membrane protein assembly factor BamD [Chlamydiia bacterium]